jgi:hypothetical protein
MSCRCNTKGIYCENDAIYPRKRPKVCQRHIRVLKRKMIGGTNISEVKEDDPLYKLTGRYKCYPVGAPIEKEKGWLMALQSEYKSLDNLDVLNNEIKYGDYVKKILKGKIKDNKMWYKVSRLYVKFMQNPTLKDILLGTGTDTLTVDDGLNITGKVLEGIRYLINNNVTFSGHDFPVMNRGDDVRYVSAS